MVKPQSEIINNKLNTKDKIIMYQYKINYISIAHIENVGVFESLIGVKHADAPHLRHIDVVDFTNNQKPKTKNCGLQN